MRRTLHSDTNGQETKEAHFYEIDKGTSATFRFSFFALLFLRENAFCKQIEEWRGKASSVLPCDAEKAPLFSDS